MIQIYGYSEECIELTEYSVNVRYPYHIELEIEDAETAILNAGKIREFILERLEFS